MGSRRHVLPAIYNANLQRFHWTPELEPAAGHDQQQAIKQEPIAGLIWMDGIEFDLIDSEDELENEENGPAIVKPENVVFPNLPNETIDLTENELTRYVIAFNASDLEPNFNDELDAQMEWVDRFPNPIGIKEEELAQEDILNDNEQNELVMDPLLGRLPFEMVCNYLFQYIKPEGNDFRTISFQLRALMVHAWLKSMERPYVYPTKCIRFCCTTTKMLYTRTASMMPNSLH